MIYVSPAKIILRLMMEINFMTSEEAIKLLENVNKIKYSEEQRKVFETRGGLRILASAGSGKTTVLTHLIAKKILTNEIDNASKVICITYSKDGALEIKDRLCSILQKTGINVDIYTATIHSYFLNILRDFNIVDSSVCICTDRLSYIKRACYDLDLNITEEDISKLDNYISFQYNNMLSSKKLLDNPMFSIDITLENYKEIQKLYQKYKQENSEIDFDDIQLLLYSNLYQNEGIGNKIIDYCKDKWRYYYIDEFQDVSKLQYAILKKLIGNSNNLVIIGDDDQNIYSWRGADPSLIISVSGDYNLTSCNLGINYRSGGEIVERAAKLIENNTIRIKKDIVPHREDGIVKVCLSEADLYTQSKQAYNYIQQL